MDFQEIILYVMNNPEIIITPVTAIAGSLISSIFFRKRKPTESQDSEFEKMKAGHLKEAVDDLLDSGEMTYTEYYKTTNFLEIAQKADEFFKGKKLEDNGKPYNFDWFMRFYDMAGSVSDEDMQILWAKILAGEVERPGSFSLRALETLLNLSREETLLFQKVCSHSIRMEDRIFVPNYKNFMQVAKINYDDLLKMEECGLINSGGQVVLHVPIGQEWRLLTENKKYALFAKSKSGGKSRNLDIKQFPFTANGIQLSYLVNSGLESDDIFAFANALINDYSGIFEFSVNQIIIDDSQYKFDNINLLENDTEDNDI